MFEVFFDFKHFDKAVYLAIFDNVLHRLRFSKLLSVVRSDIPESEALLEGLLQNGRLTFDQLVWRTMAKVPEVAMPFSSKFIPPVNGSVHVSPNQQGKKYE